MPASAPNQRRPSVLVAADTDYAATLAELFTAEGFDTEVQGRPAVLPPPTTDLVVVDLTSKDPSVLDVFRAAARACGDTPTRVLTVGGPGCPPVGGDAHITKTDDPAEVVRRAARLTTRP